MVTTKIQKIEVFMTLDIFFFSFIDTEGVGIYNIRAVTILCIKIWEFPQQLPRKKSLHILQVTSWPTYPNFDDTWLLQDVLYNFLSKTTILMNFKMTCHCWLRYVCIERVCVYFATHSGYIEHIYENW